MRQRRILTIQNKTSITSRIIRRRQINTKNNMMNRRRIHLVTNRNLSMNGTRFFAKRARITRTRVLNRNMIFTITNTLSRKFSKNYPVINLTPSTDIITGTRLLIRRTVSNNRLLTFKLSNFTLRRLIPYLSPPLNTTRKTMTLLNHLRSLNRVPIHPSIT